MLFTGDCNLSCPYCHNPGLVLDPGAFPDIPVDELPAYSREQLEKLARLAELYAQQVQLRGI